jgi:hypothetical protein
MHRLSSCLLLVVALAFIGVKGPIYVHNVRLGLAGTEAGYFGLAWLLAMLAAVVVAVRALLRDRLSQRADSRLTASQLKARPDPFRETLHQLPKNVRGAFTHRPILASVLSLIVLAIPVGLVAMATAGGWQSFGPREWVLVSLAEMPALIVAVFVLLSFISDAKSRR